MKLALYPGSFDPLTHGHLDVAERASKLTDTLIIGVAINPLKDPVFTIDERVQMVKHATEHLGNVRVEKLDGLLVNFANKVGAQTIIRGLRAVSDFDYEFQMALTNRNLSKEIDTIFLVTSPEYSFLSSTMIKQIARLGGDITPFVPEEVACKIKEKFADED
jgi:pantetheine-phosphate adenylyltransferase